MLSDSYLAYFPQNRHREHQVTGVLTVIPRLRMKFYPLKDGIVLFHFQLLGDCNSEVILFGRCFVFFTIIPLSDRGRWAGPGCW